MPYLENAFAGPIKIKVLQEVPAGLQGRKFLVQVQETARGYREGETLEAYAIHIWDRHKPAGMCRITWEGRKWSEKFPAAVEVRE